ncbi:MAG: UvrD-helicase domain-containing protein [Thermodesulfobacteriota bacterium]|nr:UvrD-helicase domain-containing protein [Thermodesulfobacteriota bacterium]
MSKIFEGLNPEQQKAVRHISGPLLIFAGAGSGKTRVIVHRVAHMISQGVDPSEILCLTFTNKAAAELKNRIEGMLGIAHANVWAGTFHAFGAWFLRKEAKLIDFPRSFVIYGAADQKSLMGKCTKELNIKKERGMDSTLAWIANMSKDTLAPYDELSFDLPFDPEEVLDLYTKRKAQSGVFDFGDLLYYPGLIMADHPDIAEKYHRRFKYILVDEYQDTNPAQYTMLMGLVGPDNNLCVVGDDDQSIYVWRGADIRNILRFKEDFPQAQSIVLEQNYRSTIGILDAASCLISNNTQRAPKRLRSNRKGEKDVIVEEFRDDSDEAAGVAYTIERLISEGVSPSQIGVFYRINALSRQIEETFVYRDIPYQVYGGMRFYERREIRDVLSYLRILYNPRDEEALGRIINIPARGIGIKTLARLQAFARKQGLSTFDALGVAIEKGEIKGRTAAGIQEFIQVMHELKDLSRVLNVGDLLLETLEKSGLKTVLKTEIDGQDRITNIHELAASARDDNDLGAYLEQKALMNPTDENTGEDTVTVMTLHMSKGLEFEHVFIMGLEEGLLPHSRSLGEDTGIEEERRLLYVGITRAKIRVMLSWAHVRALYGREHYQIPSAFLSELT